MRLVVLFLLLLHTGVSPKAQRPYSVNENAGDFAFPLVLNAPSLPSSFRQVNTKLVILDFFGTWCGPCIRALPNLKAMQEKFKEELLILLIAGEDEQLLRNFISKQEGFNLAMVVDKESAISNKFHPPYYPYSLVIDKNGRVVAIPTQGAITETAIRGWIEGQGLSATPAAIKNESNDTASVMKTKEITAAPAEMKMTNPFIQLSQDFLYAAKTGDSTEAYLLQLKNIALSELVQLVDTDDEKKAFWINLYNAYTQVILKNNPDQYKKRGQFFGSRQMEIAGHRFSLDDIEHGILRRSKIKWSLGYLNKLFPGKTEKLLRVNKLDYRLHFALNCGAKSCPPIAFYRPEDINVQLDVAAKAYLGGEAQYDAANNSVLLPAIMGWFRHDFGGKKRMTGILQRQSVIPADKTPRIRFKKYDWTLYLQNYK